MHNKHIKNRSTALRWTSLTLRLFCGRYERKSFLKYKECFVGCAIFLASSVVDAKETILSAGIGFQHAVLGVKMAKEGDVNNYFLSVGIGAYGAGIERPLTSSGNTTVGAVVGAWAIVPYGALSINYHFSGYRNKGWVLGIEGGTFLFTTATEDEDPTYSLGFINLGYKF